MSRTTEQIKETTSVMRDITTLRGPYITERNSTLVTQCIQEGKHVNFATRGDAHRTKQNHTKLE